MLEVTSAEYIEGYKIHVHFNNGDHGVVDLTGAIWGPVFEPLEDVGAFQRFKVSEFLHTICWENDADFAPEFLHAKMVEQSEAASAAATRR
jgi:hypothetical protein